MEDNSTTKKNRLQLFYAQLRTSFFNIMFELLKEKNTSMFLGCFIILIMFIQLIGHLFEPQEFEWKDQFFLNFIIQLCNYCRVIKAINDAGSAFFYWALIIFGILYLISMIALLLYMNYFLKNRKYYAENIVRLLRYMILLMYWVFYMPFFESFLSIVNCQDGYHYLDKSIECYQGLHIFYIVLCIVFLIILFAISLIIAMLFNETQPVQEDCLSRLESSFEVALVIYRSIVATFSNFCGGEVCSWVLISVFIISSTMLCYQYYKQIPYYNQFVSVFCGSLIFIYCWISINAMLMKLLDVSGHIIIIFAGIPLLYLLVKSLRDKRIESLIKTNIDKVQVDIDALIQVHNMTDFSKGINKDQTHRMTMIGIINIHVLECQNNECPCKDEYELFDVNTNQFSVRNASAPHLDEVFLNHFIKRLYEESLNKFINSPSIHIAFSFYLFKVMKNIHASLIELNIAQKKKPSLQQQFTIFRYKNIIEEFIQQDHQDHKHVYPELSNVIEFERLFGEMQRAIEKVCNLQVEFWTHLTTVVPDLNILNDLGKKVYEAGEEADMYWSQLCKINPHYQQALSIYGEYLKDIRNHEHLGNQYIERAFNTQTNKKQVDEHAKSSDILFSDDTTVIHVSGNKESVGKILKTSQGLTKVFGYSKTEVIGHSVNILMPTLFARKHTELLERFFKTGRQIIFYQERNLFATKRNGYCFHMKILVKQMPNLTEGIQYVGMIKPIVSDVEFMLTDMDGVIDSFSSGMQNQMRGLTPQLFKDKDTQINIQLLAPDLIPFFLETQRRGGKAAKSKFRDPGGETLVLYQPKDFQSIAKSEAKSNPRGGGGGGRANRGKSQASNFRNRSPIFRTFLKCLSKPKKIPRDKMPTPQQLLMQKEYVECEQKKEVTCEITCIDIKCSATDSMKMLVFKFTNNAGKDKNGGAFGKMDGNMMITMQPMDYQHDRNDGFDYCKQDTQSSRGEEDIDQQNPEFGGSRQHTYVSNHQSNATAHYNASQPSGPNSGQQLVLHDGDNQFSSMKVPQTNPQHNSVQPPQTSSQAKELLESKEPEGKEESVHGQPSTSQDKVPTSSNLKPSFQQSEASTEKKQKSSKKAHFKDEPESSESDSPPPAPAPKQRRQVTQYQKNTPKDDEDEESSETGGLQTDPEETIPPANPSQRSKQSNKEGGAQSSPPEQPAIDNLSEIETPRMDVSGLKLDSAQKEKNYFLNELKKQSFLLSEDSTQKMDAKDSINISNINGQKGGSKTSGHIQGADQRSKSSHGLNVQQDVRKMVKKENKNNMNPGRFGGDDIQMENEVEEEDYEEEQDVNQDSDAAQSKEGKLAGSSDDNNPGAAKRGRTDTNKTSNQAGRTDEDLEDVDPMGGDPSNRKTKEYEKSLAGGDSSEEERKARKKRMRQNTRFQKEMPPDSKDDDEDEEEEQQQQQRVHLNVEEDKQEKRKKLRQNTRFQKKMPTIDKDEEDEENEEFKEDEIASESDQDGMDDSNNSGGAKSGSGKRTGSLHSGRRQEVQPLLQNAAQDPTSFQRPAMGFGAQETPGSGDYNQDQNQQPYYGNNLQNPQQQNANKKPLKHQTSASGGQKAGDIPSKAMYKRIEIQKRDTKKIKTNPKYRCLDDGSPDEDDDNQKNEDYNEIGSKEQDFRETILKFERKKRRRERKMKEREQKRIKALNGEDGSGSLGTSGEPASTATPGGSEDDEDTHSKTSVSSSESDSRDGNSPDENGDRGGGKGGNLSKQENAGDGVSSVSSRQNKTERNHYILRTAIDEKFIPNSIKNLRLAANFIFLILLLLSIIYYVIQISLFSLINQNIRNIHNSESRFNYIIDITLRTRTLILLNNNYLNLNQSESDLLLNVTIEELRNSATALKVAQTDLSLKTAKLSKDQLQKINPTDIKMKYLKYPNMPDFYQFTIWEAIMEIVVSAYRISTLTLTSITDNHATVYFVMQNSLNSVLKALKSSTDAIINESNENRESNMSVFLYLLIAASCSMFFSILFLIPVINKVKKNKQEVLELFTHRNIEKHIDDQLKVCRNFVSMRLQQTNEGVGDHDIDGNQGGDDGRGNQGQGQGDKDLQNELNNNKYMKRMKKKNKGKKWKPLNSDFGATLLKFLLFICIIEGYFLANYLLSFKFLEEVQDLTKELKLLISRQPVQSFLLLIQKEMIYSNGTALIEGQSSEIYVPEYHELLYDEEEQLLDKFSANYDYHSTGYNDDFNNLVYSNVCQYVPDFSADISIQTTCESFNQGILKKGIYSSVIKYWDFLRQLNHDFMESNRSLPVIKQFLNEPRLKVAERMQDFYFKRALSKLVTKLEEDIDYFFNFQNIQNRTIFICYIIYIVLLYYFIWRRFVSILQNELWKTKSMLGRSATSSMLTQAMILSPARFDYPIVCNKPLCEGDLDLCMLNMNGWYTQVRSANK